MDNQRSEQTLLSLAAQVASRMRLRTITMIESNLIRNPLDDGGEGSLTCTHGYKAEHKYNESDKTLVAHVSFMASGGRADVEDDELFKVEAAFVASYAFSDDEPIAPEAVDAFAKLNGVFNCWPFWREYLQSSTVRMGLPPLTLPLITAASIDESFRKQRDEAETVTKGE